MRKYDDSLIAAYKRRLKVAAVGGTGELEAVYNTYARLVSALMDNGVITYNAWVKTIEELKRALQEVERV